MRQWICCLLLALIASPLLAAPPATLRMLAWPGYADADLVAAFEQRYQVKVEVTLVSSDEVLWHKLSTNQGADYDLFAANTAELQRYIAAGLVAPLDLANIPNRSKQLARFREPDLAGVSSAGVVYAVPYTYSEMGLIYDRRHFAQPPRSWLALWQPQYRGKVLMYDGGSHAFSLAALSAGQQPFAIAADQFNPLARQLVALRRNLLTLYSTPEQATTLFRERRALLMFGNFGTQQLKALRDAGVDAGYVIPDEGALAWLDCWAVSVGRRDQVLAEAWINYSLEPEVSGALTERQGLANTISANPNARDRDRIIWLRQVEDPDRRSALWQRVVAGDRPERFGP